MTKSNHRVPIIHITAIEKHPNADSLGIVHIPNTGYQTVVRLDEFKIGDYAAFVQPDSVVPERPEYSFLWEPRTFDGPVPEKYRRVTARRFRKEWSEGLLMKLPESFVFSLKDAVNDAGTPEGFNIAEQLGITHYEPPEPEQTSGEDDHPPGSKQRKRWPRSWRGWLYQILRWIGWDINGPTGGDNENGPTVVPPIYDVESFKNFKNAFQPGEQVIVTCKIHGSNARYLFDGERMHIGSRKLWKKPTAKTVWNKALEQHPWIEEWCRAHPNYTLYGEVVPTQGKYTYGCQPGQVKFFVFDILTPNGDWIPYEIFWTEAAYLHSTLGFEWVPRLYMGPFDEAKILALADGPSTVEGAKHLREGIVIRPVNERHVHGLGRLQLKVVSNEFLEKERNK